LQTVWCTFGTCFWWWSTTKQS